MTIIDASGIEHCPNFSETIVDKNCLDCGIAFKSSAMLMDGRPLFVRHRCDPCALKFDAEVKLRSQHQHEAEMLTKWAGICPWEFRTIEEGGNTDIARMAEDSPKWASVLGWTPGHRGLLVRGSTGKCKTRAMWRLLRKLFNERHKFITLTAGQFERGTRDSLGEFESEEFIDRLTNANILFLDDIGKMASTECIQSALFSLIDERTMHGRPILATTNDTGKTLSARMSEDRGAPMIRRLRDYCELLVL